ncbi:YgiQ family radical SAM protein [uncultured Alistipes sp.]|uniref:YgiQ family radical SAM protein n=1 Tax=uncultured Alistipes sp. TaxID=538949 RepID=UPI002803D2B7|nr:YgiQ family radical SAM protein [uncultured Alistipes sp.]
MFLPTTVKEVRERGWDYLDVILFTGDAYIDHPAFGAAVIGRLLEAEGYRVAIVPQPNWRDDLRDFTKLGAPRLFFGISGGAMDSMVNHYTANLRLRHDDAYTPGGRAGFRPDYAVTVYTRILKRLFPHVPVVVGGIEASLRRLTHYDYWSDALRPSVLVESGADLLIYGMGEGVVQQVARAMHNGYNAKLLRRIRQVAFVADDDYVARLDPATTIRLHSFEECRADKRAFGENFTVIETQSNLMEPVATLVERTGDRWVVVTPPNAALSTEELDHSFDLPYERAPHPRYRGKGDIPAWEMIKFSLNIHRGCFGGCSFCTISAHQGKFIHSRSERSILAEVERIVRMPDFKGYLSDIGAPSANMYRMGGRDRTLCARCRRPSCLHPQRCPNLDNDHRPLLALYEKIRAVKGIRKAFIGSGIRYDLFDGTPYLETVLRHHTSGRLKVAPEHTEEHVLRLMRKPPFALFEQLNESFHAICRREGLPYQLIPYFISSHPGCTEHDMRELAHKVLGRLHFTLEQVQDLTPTPMTLSSVMFYTGENPYTHEPVYVARTQEEKRRQKSYFFRPGQAGAAPAKRAPRGAGHAAAQDSARGAGGGPEHDATRSSSRDANRGVKRGQAAGSGKFPAKAPARTGQSERFERPDRPDRSDRSDRSDRRAPRETTASGRRPGRAKNGRR